MREDERDDLMVQAWAALKGASWAVFSRLADQTAKTGATGAQAGFLHVLIEAGGSLTPQELARRLAVTPATVTGAVNRLDEAGLVERARDQHDRRVVHVRATPKGRALVKRWRDAFIENLRSVLGPLSDDDLAQLVSLLGRVAPPLVGPPGGFGTLIKHDVAAAPAKLGWKKPTKTRGRRKT